MRLPLKLRPWFLALLEEEREKARVQEKTAYSKAFQRKVNPIAKMFALLTIAKRDATGRPAPTRTFASVAANSTHITSAPKCGVRMNDYRLRRCPCVLPLQAAIKLVCALIGRTLCACREGRDPWAKEALGILSREDVATWAEEARKCPLSEGVDMIPPRGKPPATPASLAEGALVSCRGEEVEAPSSDEDEDGFQKPRVGAGLWGHGPPLSSRLLGKHKAFTDGLGLCSPGRWAPQRRMCAKERPSLGFAEQLGKEYTKLLNQSLDLRQVALQLAVGKLEKSPFCDELVQEGRELLFCALEFAGTKLPVRSRPEGQPTFLLGCNRRAFEDQR